MMAGIDLPPLIQSIGFEGKPPFQIAFSTARFRIGLRRIRPNFQTGFRSVGRNLTRNGSSSGSPHGLRRRWPRPGRSGGDLRKVNARHRRPIGRRRAVRERVNREPPGIVRADEGLRFSAVARAGPAIPKPAKHNREGQRHCDDDHKANECDKQLR
jgi:hypothetical protein